MVYGICWRRWYGTIVSYRWYGTAYSPAAWCRAWYTSRRWYERHISRHRPARHTLASHGGMTRCSVASSVRPPSLWRGMGCLLADMDHVSRLLKLPYPRHQTKQGATCCLLVAVPARNALRLRHCYQTVPSLGSAHSFDMQAGGTPINPSNINTES